MHLSELVAVLVFLCAVVAVYVVAGALVFRAIRRRFARQAVPTSKSEVWARRSFLGLAAGGVGCMAYGHFVEPDWLEVTHHRLPCAKLPRGSQPIRIVHISDLHSEPTPHLEARLPGVIAAEKPDLIVFTGDAANSPDGVPTFRRCIERIAAIAPTYAVKGNWDVRHWVPADLFAGTGVTKLEVGSAVATVRGTRLWIGGATDWPDLGHVLATVPSDMPTLLLYHFPDAAHLAAKHGVDLYCCGHTHGGQVALPFYGALVTLSRFGKRYEAGLYRVQDTWLYVNRGIGTEGSTPRVRFCARPEVTVIDLVPPE